MVFNINLNMINTVQRTPTCWDIVHKMYLLLLGSKQLDLNKDYVHSDILSCSTVTDNYFGDVNRIFNDI